MDGEEEKKSKTKLEKGKIKTVSQTEVTWKLKEIPYSGKFSLVRIFAEMRPYSSAEIFTVFIFVERKRDALTTPLPDDGHDVYRRNDTE